MADNQNETEAQGRLKVFVSYSRADIAFADQLVLALEDKGFEPLLDRHDIDAAEKWKDRLGALIFSCDTVVFVLSETSAASPICRWEVEHAAAHGKRMIPVTPHPVEGVAPPPQLSELNYVPFYSAPAVPGSGFYSGVQKLAHALKVDLGWLRQQTRLSEQAAEWARDKPDDLLLRGVAQEEALGWRTRTPKGGQVLALVRDYIAASETAGEQRKAEAQAQIAERETALAQAEAALAQKARADKLARRATLIGAGVAAVLILLAGWLSLTAARATHTAGENRAAIFAGEADARIADSRHAEAMMIALAGDPAARRGWFEQLMAPGGYNAARTALVAGYTHTRLVRILEGHESWVLSASFSPDGTRIATASEDRTARVWDASSGRAIATLSGHEGEVRSASFSPDGTRIVTASGDSTARVWDAGPNTPDDRRVIATLSGMRAMCRAPASAQTEPASSPPLSTTPRACGMPAAAAPSPP